MNQPNLADILAQMMAPPSLRTAHNGDRVAAMLLAQFDLDAAEAMEAAFAAAVHIMILSRKEVDLAKALDSIDPLFLLAKHDVLDAIHSGYHGAMTRHAGEPDAQLRAETSHQTSLCGALLRGSSDNGSEIYPNTHENIKRALTKFRSQVETLSAAMKESKEAPANH